MFTEKLFCFKSTASYYTSTNKRFKILNCHFVKTKIHIPIWKDSWQSEGTILTISNWGILNPLAINTGSVFFHSSRSSSIVLETKKLFLLIEIYNINI